MSRKFYTTLAIMDRESLQLYDADSGEYIGLKAPTTVTSSFTLSWPSSAGTPGQALSTDGTDTLSWASYIAAVSSPTDNTLPRFDGTGGTTLQGSGIVVDDSNNISGVAGLTLSGVITASSLAASRVLTTNGSSVLEASSVTSTELGYLSGVTSAIQTQLGTKMVRVTDDWETADGTSLAVTHGLETKDVVVSIYDKSDDQEIMVDTITRTDTNTVTLTASQAPEASGWRVVIIG